MSSAPLDSSAIDRILSLHQQAVASHSDSYTDPATGYKVFTSAALSRRQCCGNACRHCPYQWRGVKNPAFISQANVQIRARQQRLDPVSLNAEPPPRTPPSPSSPSSPPSPPSPDPSTR